MNSTAEHRRLEEDRTRTKNWKRWGPYLSERQWGTVREDYSENGDAWRYFSREQAPSRAYRWGEDGLLGITDRQCRLCFSVALWNGKDPILKERLFGLNGHEGNHGEDVKECYYYLDSTPTHSYMKGIYKYPQREFPYDLLLKENARRSRKEREFELIDTGAFADDRYFDVQVEYAKAGPNDVLIRLRVTNCGEQEAALHVLPTIWFRNTWSWNCDHEGCSPKPRIWLEDDCLRTRHALFESFRFSADAASSGESMQWLFTDNETNKRLLFDKPEEGHFKDAFHDYLINEKTNAVSKEAAGTKAAAHYALNLAGGQSTTIDLRLVAESEWTEGDKPFGAGFDTTFAQRLQEADDFHASVVPTGLSPDRQLVARQSNAGLLWTKQFYNYAVEEWLEGDPDHPASESRKSGRNSLWTHLFNRDVISMPDKWEYPWYAAWDSAFHMIPFRHIDPDYTEDQLILFLREWYMHPNGQLPAYEWALGDVNPPVHAWACLRHYQSTKQHRRLGGDRGRADREFLARAFQKLLLNFTWWVNRKDVRGKNIFAGGFLGLDNIGIFDRSKPLPTGGHLEQADGTAWIAYFCASMLSIAFELASQNPVYSDMASKFFEHYVRIAEAMNTLDGTGLWDEQDGFYYDHLHVGETSIPLRIRSMVGLVPLFTVNVMYDDVIDRLPGFQKRMNWFLQNRELSQHMSCMDCDAATDGLRMMAIPSRDRLQRMLGYLLDEDEFLSPYGIRSLSKYHEEHPFTFNVGGQEMRVAYEPGESSSPMFGGNSNWRGPIWMPMNYLVVESLRSYGEFYGDSLKVECPTGSGNMMNLTEVAAEIEDRLIRLFVLNSAGRRPLHGEESRYSTDGDWSDLVLFYEYFHAETGEGLGASHQTGWTSLVSQLLINSLQR